MAKIKCNWFEINPKSYFVHHFSSLFLRILYALNFIISLEGRAYKWSQTTARPLYIASRTAPPTSLTTGLCETSPSHLFLLFILYINQVNDSDSSHVLGQTDIEIFVVDVYGSIAVEYDKHQVVHFSARLSSWYACSTEEILWRTSRMPLLFIHNGIFWFERITILCKMWS